MTHNNVYYKFHSCFALLNFMYAKCLSFIYFQPIPRRYNGNRRPTWCQGSFWNPISMKKR